MARDTADGLARDFERMSLRLATKRIPDQATSGRLRILAAQRLAKPDRALATHAGEEIAGTAHPHPIAVCAEITR